MAVVYSITLSLVYFFRLKYMTGMSNDRKCVVGTTLKSLSGTGVGVIDIATGAVRKGFDNLPDQISHRIANGSLPQRFFFRAVLVRH